MKYLGGKHRIAKRLAEVMNPVVRKAGAYIEPFVGGASVMCQIDPSVARVGADANQALISMWTALTFGWEPPENVSEEEYRRIRAIRDPEDPLTAFIGIGCCFGGTWWGGYARGFNGTRARNYAAESASLLRKKMLMLTGVRWQHADYRSITYPQGAVIYCDPPYAGTSDYKAVGPFNSEDFWQFCREKALTNPIFVSEYKAPLDFECILEIPTKLSVRSVNGNEPRIERLFVHKSQA
jgi:DNA adenine methylase